MGKALAELRVKRMWEEKLCYIEHGTQASTIKVRCCKVTKFCLFLFKFKLGFFIYLFIFCGLGSRNLPPSRKVPEFDGFICLQLSTWLWTWSRWKFLWRYLFNSGWFSVLAIKVYLIFPLPFVNDSFSPSNTRNAKLHICHFTAMTQNC